MHLFRIKESNKGIGDNRELVSEDDTPDGFLDFRSGYLLGREGTEDGLN